MITRMWGMTVAALGAALVLGACQPATESQPDQPRSDAGPVLESRSADAPRAADAASDAFEFLRYAVDVDSPTPSLCLTFSAALDPDADYSAYAAVDEPVAFSVDGARLCIGGLTYGQTRTLELRTGLPAADGRALDADETITLTFDDRPAYVGFAGTGVILPRIDADGLAVETVNVDAVQIVISRVNDRALAFREINAGFTAGAGEWRWTGDREAPGDLGVEVWRGRMDTAGPANAAVTTVLPLAQTLGALEPGAYYVELDDAAAVDREQDNPARARRWLIVTDLAFTAYRGETGLDVVVRSLQSAAPAAGVEVQLVAASNEILATARTNGQGRVRFDAPLINGAEGDAPRLLTAYGPEGDFALLDLQRAPVDLSSQPVSGRARAGLVDAFTWLDRGVYRPGETVYANAVLRDGAGRAVTGRAGALVLYQPNGLEHARHRFDAAPDAGGVSHGFDLPRAAARGVWRLAVELDGLGRVGGEALSVEDFVPQRVALDLSVDDDTPMNRGETRLIEAHARFLYGAPGAGLPLSGEARLQRDPRPFPQHEGFSFGRHDAPFAEDILDLPATTADGAGNAALALSPGSQGADASWPLRLRAVVRVQEPGGRAVADDVRIPYRPRARYVGLRAGFDGRAERNAAVRYDLLAVDRLGAPMAGAFDWRLVRKDYQYDWYRTEGGAWRWRRSERIVPIETGRVTLDGAAPAAITTPPLDWGDYALIVSADGEDVASAGFWVGWGGYADDGEPAPDEVRVAGPEAAPSAGDTAVIAIQAPYAGLAEVVVATDRVLETRQIAVTEAGAEITLPVTEDWGAGAYVMVSVYTPRDAVSQPRPRRAVGVAYVPVDVSDRTIGLTLGAPELAAPNQTLTVPVQAEGGPVGERVWVSLAAVDESILRLTGFASPDPVDWIFGKPRLDVALLDDYGRLLDPNQGAAAPVRSGGDQIGGAGLSVVPTQTVALVTGPVRLDRQGWGEVTLDLPDFNGELRLMAVAWSETGAGAASQPMTVRDAVPAELVLPRFLAPGDQVQATLTLDNVDGAAGTYAASVSAEGAVSVRGGEIETDLPQGERYDAPVTLIGEAEGIASLALAVTGPDGFAADSLYPIEVRSPYLPTSRVERIVLQPGDTYTPPSSLLAGFAPGSGLVQVSAASSPIDAAALYQSLYRYPYACTEQLVSRAAPLISANQLARLAGEDAPQGAAGEVRAAIETLLARQSADGAFGLWRVGDVQASPWVGAYAADFLSRAAEAGYPVPRAALERALAALQPVSQAELWRASGYLNRTPNPRWSRDTRQRIEDRSAAYALYVLARNGQADRSRLRYMHDARLSDIESPLARAHIGAALAAMGDRARAASAFEAAVEALGYRNDGDWYQTPLRDLAGVAALAAEAGQTELVEQLTVLERLNVPEPARLTTQEKAFLIFAAQALAGDSDTVTVAYSGEAETPAALVFDEAGLAEAGVLTNTGDQPVFVTVLARGAPDASPAAAASELALDKRVLDLTGKPVNLANVRQGDRLLIALDMRPQRRADASFVIADLLPAGFEIEALVTAEEAGPNGPYAFLGEQSRPSIAEARDDRFVAAIDARADQTVRLAYLVRAVSPGAFAIPGAVAEDMYRPDVFARTAPGRVTITP